MKKITLILFALFTSWQINAQSLVIGTGTTTTTSTGSDPIDGYYESFRYQVVYTAAELSASMTPYDEITALGFSIAGDYAGGNLIGYTIKMGHTSATNAATHNSSPTVVVKNPFNYNPTVTSAGVFDMISFDSNFVWNGVDNILVEICSDGPNAYVSPYGQVRMTTMTSGSRNYRVDGGVSCNVNTSTTNGNRPNIQFNYIEGTPPSCLSPNALNVNNISSSSATLGWTENGSASLWNIEYGITGFTQGSGTLMSGVTNPQSLSGLSPNTVYQFYVQSDCGGSQSTWSGPYSFTTPCVPYTIPYFEGFESGYTHNATVAGCLSQASVTGTGVWTINSTNTDYNRTPRTGSYNATLVYSNEDWIFIPIQLVGGTSYRVSLYARQDGATIADSNMAISYGTANNAASMTNSVVASTGIINGNYQEVFGDFTPSTSGTYYVGIKGYMNGTPWYISLDDISIVESPTCLNPTGIVASNITSNSVDLSWTDGSGGLQFDYEYAIQAPGTGIPTGAGAPIDDVTVLGEGFDINGNPLTANTLYEVYVRSVCGGGDFSTWSGPITFRTLCDAVGSINENFDSVTTPALPDCWGKILRGTTLSTFATVTTTGTTLNSAPNSVALYNSSSATTTTDDIILVSPYLSNLNAGTHRLKFYARTTGSIQVGTLNNNTASAVFTPFQTVATTATSTLYVVDFSTYTGTDTFIGFRHNAGTYITIYIDDVVWEPIPATPPSCASNVVATPNPSCGNFANSLTWDATPNADGYYISVGTTSGGTDVANAIVSTTNSYSFSGNFGTQYFYTVVPYNAIGLATGCTEQSFTTNANGCYCVSAPTSVDGTGITNIQLVTTDFPNTVSTSPVYNDHTATVVDMSQGINNNVQISFNTSIYDYNTVIWVDFNDNYNLESSEIVYTGLSSSTSPNTLNASFVMPGTAPLGQHRMRIVATDALQNPVNPCYSGTYGETADFTINVVAASCTPPAATATLVPACGTSQFSIDVNVTALGSGTPSITDGTSTWPISATGVVNVGPFASGSSVSLTLLHGSDSTCNLPLSSMSYTCPPSNDACLNAEALTPGGVFADNALVGTNVGATDATETIPTCASYNGGEVWYSVIVPASGNITIETDTNSSNITDTGLAIYSGACGSLTQVGCDDDGGNGAFSLVSLTNRTPGETLLVSVWEYGGGSFGTFKVSAYDASLSSNSFDNANFKAYPNPVKDVLNISYATEISSVSVINMIGQEVLSKNINATSSQVDMSQLSAGTYIVNVTLGDTIKTLKVVKQ